MSVAAASQASARLRRLELHAFDLSRARSDLDPKLLSKFSGKSIKLGHVNQFPETSNASTKSHTRNRTDQGRSVGIQRGSDISTVSIHSSPCNQNKPFKAPRAMLAVNHSATTLNVKRCSSCSCCPWWVADYGPVIICGALIVTYIIVVVVTLEQLWSSSPTATNHT